MKECPVATKKQIILPIAVLVGGIALAAGFSAMKKPPEEKPEQKPSGPQQAKDLANDPSAWSAESRGTEWDASYRGSSDSAEWEDDYAEAQDDGDEEKLKQIQWFGEKQGWGKDGQMGESLVSKLKREFKEYKVYNKNIRKI